MRAIEPPDSHYLSAAIGWVELGNPAEAKAELAQLSPSLQAHPDVLEVRWLICAESAAWEEGLLVAQKLMQVAPDRASGWLHQAYALRRVPGGNVHRAWEALRPAFEKFPKESVIPYNLCCYACQMQQLDEARVWLQHALQAGDKTHIKAMALTDPDLEPLREEIARL